MVERYLEDLELHLDCAIEDDLLAQWHRFWEGGTTEPLFSPRREQPVDGGLVWPAVNVNQALEDLDMMVLQQYAGCANAIRSGNGTVLNVRANYGVGILPTVFGARMFFMDEEANCLPNVWPLGGEDRMRALLDAGMPDLSTGLGCKVFEAGERFANIAATYPKIGRYVHTYHPDLQGPMDVCELLWGSEIFLALVDQGDLVHQCLQRVTDTYVAFMNKWNAIAPPRETYNAHWGMLMKGCVAIRDDSAMNLSPTMFREFIVPYNQRLLREFGGGLDHFCGRGDHFVSALAELDGLTAVNLSQPEYNDMETIFRSTVDRGIKLLGLGRQAGTSAVAEGRDLKGHVHCP